MRPLARSAHHVSIVHPLVPTLALGAWLAVAAPSALAAQYAEVSVFSSWNPALADGLPMYGGSLGGGAGVGLRLSGAMRTSVASTPATATDGSAPRPYGLVVDMDFTYDSRDNALLAPIASALLGFSPSLFVGAGAIARRDADVGLRAAPSFSYGGGMSRPLLGGLGLTSEARYRTLVRGANGSLPEGLRPGWEYRAGLALRFGGSRRSGGGGAGEVLSRLPMPGSGAGTMGTARGSAVIATADDYLGVPYVYGGTSPRGFDCSGFVQYVFERNGVRLPRTSRQQAQVGRALPTNVASLKTGDLVMFATEGSRVDHVAIYAGRNRILHSSSSGGGVRFDDLTTPRGRWFVSKMVTARRVTDGGASLVDDATLARLLREGAKSFDAPDRAPRP